MDNLKTTQVNNNYMWQMMFGIKIWWLWKWQNNKNFGRDEDIPINHVGFLCTKLKEIQNALVRDKLKNQSTHKEKTEVLIRWVAPPVSWVLLNTDGASRGNPGEAGGGGILRDSRGYFLRAFTENYGICTVTRAEILALLRGIVMARDVGIRKLIIKLDSGVVARLMEGETIHHSPAFYSSNRYGC
ncbi:hypothetical protein CTI12_AA521190 [Artemisia annua]|uniref:RNase H type-1 domain-containing protein n=1 Tax=Artemisia annua TaxID=35608 RepID=A0A2U1L7U5_ARTAN|nr:hypothetical protein CTI12_AA521190 [Artemisia annua]